MPFLTALETQPRLAKIPDTQIEQLGGQPSGLLDASVAAARAVREMGIHWGLVPYTDYSTVFATPDGVFLGTICGVDRASAFFTTRDARMAGLVAADADGMNTVDSIRFAMACAAENSTCPDRNLAGRDAVNSFMDKVKIEKLD